MRWLGFDWGEHLFYASDYFEQLYEWAVHLIRTGLAYVDDLVRGRHPRASRHAHGAGHRHSPWRDRLRRGEPRRCSARCAPASSPTARGCCAPGSTWRRATSTSATRCSTASCTPRHPRTGDAWCIYPTYDFAHGQSDAIEGITHSICTLEFERSSSAVRLAHRAPAGAIATPADRVRAPRPDLHRAVQALPAPAGEGRPRARLGRPPDAHDLGHAPARLSGRGIRDVRGHDRRRQGRRQVEIGQLEYAVRDVLNRQAPRRFGVLRPLKVVIENYPEGQVEEIDAINNPEDPSAGTRRVAVRPGAVDRARRLHGGTAREVLPTGAWPRGAPPVRVLHHLHPGHQGRRRARSWSSAARYDPATRGGDAPDGRRPKATLHWVSAAHALPAEVRLYEHLFTRPDPGADGDLIADLNPDSETVLRRLCRTGRGDAAAWARPCSSSGWATSASTRIPGPVSW